jgi:hypothetical protein
MPSSARTMHPHHAPHMLWYHRTRTAVVPDKTDRSAPTTAWGRSACCCCLGSMTAQQPCSHYQQDAQAAIQVNGSSDCTTRPQWHSPSRSNACGAVKGRHLPAAVGNRWHTHSCTLPGQAPPQPLPWLLLEPGARTQGCMCVWKTGALIPGVLSRAQRGATLAGPGVVCMPSVYPCPHPHCHHPGAAAARQVGMPP